MSISLSTRKAAYNWELAFVMYCGGMAPSDIIKHKSFRGMTIETLNNKISTNGWPSRRAEIAQLRASDILTEKAKELAEALKIEGIKHQEFMLSELKRERRVFENREKTEEGQMERMQILDKMDVVARRTSKLDEQKEGNAVTNGFALLVHLQGNTQPALKNASTGILRSNNAHLEAPETIEIDPAPEPAPPDVKPMPLPGNLFGAKPL